MKPDQDQLVRKWNPIFSTSNRGVYDRAFSGCLNERKVKRNRLDSFLQHTESSVPSRESMDPIHHLDVVRRLIYIPELTLEFISVLAETASWNEVDHLGAGIRRHIARDPLIQVHIPLTGFLTFRLELSLPYLILRKRNYPPSPTVDVKNREKQLATDLSFLNMESSTGERPTSFSILKAHDTILIFGCDHSQWTGYAISDHRPTSTDCWQVKEEDKIQGNDSGKGDDEDEAEESDDDEEEMPNEDLFASGGSDQILDADNIVWDPREYFLRTAAIRIGVIFDEYSYLVQTLEAGITDWMTDCIYADSNPLHNLKERRGIKESFNGTMQIKEILYELRKHLSSNISAWNRFSGPSGDLSFFNDITEMNAKLALHSIEASFARLGFLEPKLDLLDRLCGDSAKALTLRMEVESNLLSHQTHNLNIRNVRLSRKTTKIAMESQRAAEETCRTTRTNVQLLLTTTPFAFALQYFCGERNVFSIERTPKTFTICLLILLFALPLVTLVVEAFNSLRKTLVRNLTRIMLRKMGRQDHPKIEQDASVSESDCESQSSV
ncbi:hypothetical protein BKA66DRAFT_539696 [Pyrenochaeta sp. MPI-SDFR-AT-0127]|nr:hypothetical protein BKA66DRAFT_539696 [Pyrenochaeta sp. MPI-SDFR-AT-0127]